MEDSSSKGSLADSLHDAGFEVVDFGADQLNPSDDYPDFIVPLARAVAAGEVERGVAICGSGVGSTIVANKVPGVRAGLINHVFCAHQGVEDDDMNVCCLGGKVVGAALAWELVQTFLAAQLQRCSTPPAPRWPRSQALENQKDGPLRAHARRLNRLARTSRQHWTAQEAIMKTAIRATGKLHDMGQSLWLDNITRSLLTSGTLQPLHSGASR